MTSKQMQDKEHIVTFRVTQEELDRLDRLATCAGLSRSQFVRNIVDIGMDEFEIMQKLGIIRASLTVRDILDWLTDKAKTRVEDIDKSTSSKA